MPNFQYLYKMLSIYSILKPPKTGNCCVTENEISLIKSEDLRNIYVLLKSKSINIIKQKLHDSLINTDNFTKEMCAFIS